jgi:hypothetical protein
MPVRKFRSAEEMNATPVPAAPAGDFARFLRHCARFRLISPKSNPRGVFKFRDLAEAQAARSHDSLRRADAGDERRRDRSGAADPRVDA